ncbi:methyltransferase [Nocardioides guangzhouensis]|uniref:Methyltransferase n=1 Tax=Nocardioides guangzhouensis TaxID=2497878 RepID=A0A4Q4Z880_9ACTN|nr:methyltransferase [Nocardioides guangzhouensis]
MTRRTRGFGHLTIAYDDRVPRPEPWLAEQSRWAADIVARSTDGDLLETCCGAGQVGLLAVALGQRPIVQVDACPVACGYARANADDAGLAGLVEVRRGTPCEALSPAERFALMLADPTPCAGADELTMACLDVAGHHLLPGGSLLLRVGPGRLEVVRREAAWNDLRVVDARHFGDQGSLVRLDVPPGS